MLPRGTTIADTEHVSRPVKKTFEAEANDLAMHVAGREHIILQNTKHSRPKSDGSIRVQWSVWLEL